MHKLVKETNHIPLRFLTHATITAALSCGEKTQKKVLMDEVARLSCDAEAMKPVFSRNMEKTGRAAEEGGLVQVLPLERRKLVLTLTKRSLNVYKLDGTLAMRKKLPYDMASKYPPRMEVNIWETILSIVFPKFSKIGAVKCRMTHYSLPWIRHDGRVVLRNLLDTELYHKRNMYNW